MNITVQGSAQRVKLTKSEATTLHKARDILRQLDRICGDEDAGVAGDHVGKVMFRIDVRGNYTTEAREPRCTVNQAGVDAK